MEKKPIKERNALTKDPTVANTKNNFLVNPFNALTVAKANIARQKMPDIIFKKPENPITYPFKIHIIELIVPINSDKDISAKIIGTIIVPLNFLKREKIYTINKICGIIDNKNPQKSDKLGNLSKSCHPFEV
jgi:hypothetical protein